MKFNKTTLAALAGTPLQTVFSATNKEIDAYFKGLPSAIKGEEKLSILTDLERSIFYACHKLGERIQTILGKYDSGIRTIEDIHPEDLAEFHHLKHNMVGLEKLGWEMVKGRSSGKCEEGFHCQQPMEYRKNGVIVKARMNAGLEALFSGGNMQMDPLGMLALMALMGD